MGLCDIPMTLFHEGSHISLPWIFHKLGLLHFLIQLILFQWLLFLSQRIPRQFSFYQLLVSFQCLTIREWIYDGNQLICSLMFLGCWSYRVRIPASYSWNELTLLVSRSFTDILLWKVSSMDLFSPVETIFAIFSSFSQFFSGSHLLRSSLFPFGSESMKLPSRTLRVFWRSVFSSWYIDGRKLGVILVSKRLS